MSYANRKQMGSNRTAGIIVVALIHVALGYALVTGLAYNVVKKAAEDLKTFDVNEPPPARQQSANSDIEFEALRARHARLRAAVQGSLEELDQLIDGAAG